MAKIFISKSITTEDHWAKSLMDEGHELLGVSCIETQRIKIEEVPPSDWTFFSSAQGVKHFLDQHSVSSSFIGVMGEGTLKALTSFGLSADFIGQSSDPEMVGKAFASELKPNQSILFPASLISKQNIAKQIIGHPILHLPCYQTLPKANQVGPHDLYLFTSPSNVDGFLLGQPLPDAVLMAYGPTTGAYLKDQGAENVTVLHQITDTQLYSTIKEKVSG